MVTTHEPYLSCLGPPVGLAAVAGAVAAVRTVGRRPPAAVLPAADRWLLVASAAASLHEHTPAYTPRNFGTQPCRLKLGPVENSHVTRAQSSSLEVCWGMRQVSMHTSLLPTAFGRAAGTHAAPSADPS